MQVWERFPGKWYIRYRHKGKQIWRLVGHSQSEAMAELRKLKKQKLVDSIDLPELKTQKSQHVIFDDLAIEYLEHSKSDKTQKTYRNEKIRVNAHWLPLFRGRLLDEISPLEIQQWKEKRTREGVSTHTLYSDLKLLKTMFSRAIEWKLYSGDNPVGRLPRTINRQPIVLDQDIIQNYLAACPSYYYPIAATLICTGIRSGELINLKWSDIDFNREMLNVRPESSRKNEQGRQIPLYPDLLPVLKALPCNSEYVFPGLYGQRVHFRRGHEKARAAIGMPNLRIHDLRHAFITLLINQGLDVVTISKLAGHKSIKVTMEIYHHLNPDVARKVIKSMPIKLELQNVTGSTPVADPKLEIC